MKKFLVFDTETTGIDVFEDRVVQLVISICDEGGNVLKTHEWIINPGVEVPEGSAEVHGFTTEYLQENGMSPREALGEAYGVFRDNESLIWVAYNMNYDVSILDNEFERHGIDPIYWDYVSDEVSLFDPLVVDRAQDKYRKGKRKLENVAGHYGVAFNPDEAHKADYDVEITAKVAARVLETFGQPTTKQQSVWYRSWAQGLQDYLRRSDPTAEVNGDWPLRIRVN